jgi:hypothetical protein
MVRHGIMVYHGGQANARFTQMVSSGTLTGHGLKDPDIAISQSPEPITIPKGGEGLRDLILSSLD